MEEEASSGCPRCGRSDSVRKLSLDFAELSLHPPPEGGEASDLSPPPKPIYRGLIDRADDTFKTIVGFTVENVGCLTGMGMFFALVIIPGMAWLILTAWLAATLFGIPFSMEAQIPGRVGALWMVLFIVPPAIAFIQGSRKKAAFLREKMPPWEDAILDWARSFRCEACEMDFTSDRPQPLGESLSELKGEVGEGSGQGSDPRPWLPVFRGVGKRGICAACGREMSRIRFGYREHLRLPQEVALKVMETGVACPECDALVCNDCKDKALGINSWSGTAKAACPECGASMATPDILVYPTSWHDTLLALLSEAKAQSATATEE